jgi:hypothetical protein
MLSRALWLATGSPPLRDYQYLAGIQIRDDLRQSGLSIFDSQGRHTLD